MTCRQCEDRLSAYVDDALGARERALVGAHLSSCARCEELAGELRRLKELLGSSSTPEPRREFWPGALHRIAPIVNRRRAVRLVLRVRVAGVAIAAGVLGLVALQIPQQNVERRATAAMQDPVESPTFDPAALVSMHAAVRATRPLADAAKVRFAISEGNARDYAIDSRLDGQ